MKNKTFDKIAESLRTCSSVLFITGAGISAESGIPTYRGIGGLYEMEETVEGLPIEVLLSGIMMHQNPEISWKYIRQVEEACRGATFNSAHKTLAEMEVHFDRFWVLTQNVDSFHVQAGNQNIIEIHGNLRRLKCVSCGRQEEVENFEHLPALPKCDDCGNLVRPDVVLFGELLPVPAVDLLTNELGRGFDAVFSVGTSSLFPYISEPVHQAKAQGALTVEINPGKTDISAIVDYKLSMGAVEALTGIWEAYLQART